MWSPCTRGVGFAMNRGVVAATFDSAAAPQVQALRLMPAEKRLLIQRHHRDDRAADWAVAPYLMDQRTTVGVDRLQALRAHESARPGLQERVALPEHAQRARVVDPQALEGLEPRWCSMSWDRKFEKTNLKVTQNTYEKIQT